MCIKNNHIKCNYYIKKKNLLFGIVLFSSLNIRQILSAINSVFDLLEFSAPVLITGKILYSQLGLLKLGWDQPSIPNELSQEWQT